MVLFVSYVGWYSGCLFPWVMLVDSVLLVIWIGAVGGWFVGGMWNMLAWCASRSFGVPRM